MLYKFFTKVYRSTFRPIEMFRNGPVTKQIYNATISPAGILKRKIKKLRKLLLVNKGFDLHFINYRPYLNTGDAYFLFDPKVPDLPAITLTKRHENESFEELRKLLKKKDVFIDVGAFMGWYSIHLAKAGCSVHCFEPTPNTFKLLTHNVKFNKLKNIICNNLAVGEENTILKMKTDVFANNHISEDGKVGVKVTCLDDYVKKQKIKPKAIKIDVEGFEFKVLKGAANTLERDKPAILIELMDKHLRRQGDSSKKIRSYLAKIGYTEKKIDVRNSLFTYKKKK